ncbi:MAG: peptidogalycan biosysnthesis protein [Candidatus Accumulibacter necessarius]|jgi:predicted N-acyltransferase|uniref:peptidogalycan biosysnthesis protein n=1 Tax=Candidatus Accumulibacter necessarius TaxID=2954386 RepID=UPI002FC314DE
MIAEPDLPLNISVSSRSSASAIPGEAWTRLCPAGHPFLNADFLAIVERHGAAAPESGWTARHLVASSSFQQ